MNKFRVAAAGAVLSIVSSAVLSQSLRGPQAAALADAQALRAGDYIVAIVNSEPITNLQVSAEVARARQQWDTRQRALPNNQELARQVLDQMINERAQLQLAQELGIKVDQPSIDQAEQNVASQNGLTVEQLRSQVRQEGMDPRELRQKLHDQLVLTRLREREVEPRVRVSDAEVDQYLEEQKGLGADPAKQQINVAHVLVAVPEHATAEEVAARGEKAAAIAQRARAGEDFAALARAYSDAPDRVSGGALGLRPGDRYPSLFLEAVTQLSPGGVAGPVRSGAGYHVLKLLERHLPGLPPSSVSQSHARHILLVPSTQLRESQALEKLQDFKRRILAGQADFGSLAREHSQDGSAAQGGDLGWVNPGQFVPEFERVMNQLAPGQLSEPLISRFGVHLIQLLERREAELGEREQREMVRSMLRQRKLGEFYINWVRDVRARAYVELRDPPQ